MIDGAVALPVVALTTLAATMTLVLARPRGLPEAAGSIIGAVVAIGFGVSVRDDVFDGIRNTAGILAFLVATMALAGVAEAAGVFRWAAGIALISARGRGWLLYVNLSLLGAVVTLLLSLDVTVVVLTPLVCALVMPLRLDARPFVIACAFVANVASLALPVSNLTNMLIYDLLDISFLDFVRYLAMPNLAVIVVTIGALLLRYRHSLPGAIRVTAHDFHVPRSPFFQWSAVMLALTVVGLLVAGTFGVPFWPVACVGASVLGGAAVARGWMPAASLLRTVAWGLPPFVVAMHVVCAGVVRAMMPWLLALPDAAGALGGPWPVVTAMLAATVGSNGVNNLPMALVVAQLLAGVSADAVTADGAPLRTALAFGALLGTNVGPNFTVTGSLATMLCLASARRAGLTITNGDVMRAGLVVTPPALVIGAALLWVSL